METTGLLVLTGSIPVDLVFRVPRLPRSGEDVLGSAGEYFVGGGYIVLYAAYQAGVRSRFGGRIGTGPHGDQIRDSLINIDCESIQPTVEDNDSTLVVVLVEPNGERSFITADNPDLFIGPGDLQRICPRPHDVVYVSGYEFTSAARVHGINTWLGTFATSTVVCDLGPYGAAAGLAALKDLIPNIDWISMNAAESLAFTGARDIRSAVDAVTECHPEMGILVRNGPAGTVLKPPTERAIRVPALRIEHVVDTNGAGDTHAGTFCAGLIRKLGPVQATWLANCAAGLSVTEFGSATAPPIAVSGGFDMPALLEPFQ